MSPALTCPAPMLAPPSAGGFGAAGVPVRVSPPGEMPEQAASKAAAKTTANRRAVRPLTSNPDRSTIIRFAPFGPPPTGYLTTAAPTVLDHGSSGLLSINC